MQGKQSLQCLLSVIASAQHRLIMIVFHNLSDQLYGLYGLVYLFVIDKNNLTINATHQNNPICDITICLE